MLIKNQNHPDSVKTRFLLAGFYYNVNMKLVLVFCEFKWHSAANFPQNKDSKTWCLAIKISARTVNTHMKETRLKKLQVSNLGT